MSDVFGVMSGIIAALLGAIGDWRDVLACRHRPIAAVAEAITVLAGIGGVSRRIIGPMRGYRGDCADLIGVLADVVGVRRSLLGVVAGAISVLRWAIPFQTANSAGLRGAVGGLARSTR